MIIDRGEVDLRRRSDLAQRSAGETVARKQLLGGAEDPLLGREKRDAQVVVPQPEARRARVPMLSGIPAPIKRLFEILRRRDRGGQSRKLTTARSGLGRKGLKNA